MRAWGLLSGCWNPPGSGLPHTHLERGKTGLAKIAAIYRLEIVEIIRP